MACKILRDLAIANQCGQINENKNVQPIQKTAYDLHIFILCPFHNRKKIYNIVKDFFKIYTKKCRNEI